MATPNLLAWLTEGAEVQASGGGHPDGRVLTVSKITQTRITLSDGTRWRTKDLTWLGGPAYDPDRVYGARGPRRLRSVREVEAGKMSAAARAVGRAAADWAYRSGDEALTAALRDAIAALAPHLGLTVTTEDPVEVFRAALVDHFERVADIALGQAGRVVALSVADAIRTFQPKEG